MEEKIVHLRQRYHLGPDRIFRYLRRYHPHLKVSASGEYRVLKRLGLKRLTSNAKKRTVQTERYEKQVPGHRIQVDVKFLSLTDRSGNRVQRFQYTAVDDATRIRALKIYRRHNQKDAIDFADYMIEKFPFRIQTVRTDRVDEFQAQFHWHVEDKGIRHVYIKPRSPQLNGKVERSHISNQEEFYQFSTYTDDVDLNTELEEWEHLYNYDRPRGAFNGKTPYETLKNMLT